MYLLEDPWNKVNCFVEIIVTHFISIFQFPLILQKKHTAAPQPKLRPQQLWSISLSSPNSPSARALILNSPLTPNPYATPGNSHRYRQASSLTTPVTPFSPLRRSARIAGQTPTPSRDGKTRTRTGGRRTTPKRWVHVVQTDHLLTHCWLEPDCVCVKPIGIRQFSRPQL